MADQKSSDGAARVKFLDRLVLLRPGEFPIVAWSAGYFFFLLLSYFMLRPVREALGISRSLDDLPWLMTATMVAMIVVNPLFALVVSKMPRRKFIPLVNRVFMANLIGFAAWFAWGAAPHQAAYTFYVWLSVFNLFVVSVFWAFMADAHGVERSKRVYGMVAVGGTAGALAGSALTGRLVSPTAIGEWVIQLKPYMVLIAAVVPLELAVQCMRRVAARTAAERERAGIAATHGEPGPGILDGLSLIGRSRYLGFIAIYVFVFAVTSTLLYLEQARMIKAEYPDDAARTAAFANLDSLRQGATLIVQVFLTGRIVKLLGVSKTLAALPLVTLGGFVALWAHPTLGVLMWIQVIRHATHHAIDRPTREMLYTVVGPNERYKSKSFIDTFIYRFGDVVGTWLPKGLASLGVVVTPVAIVAALVWAGVGIGLGVMNRKRREEIHPGVDDPRCLYNLAGLPAQGICPECGKPVEQHAR